MPTLTLAALRDEAAQFSASESAHQKPTLYGVSDGKAIGTYLEHKFRSDLRQKGYEYEVGNAAYGLDFPGLAVDMKVTSIRQPQSSCPFRSIRQKVYGLGYSLLVFIYDKRDDPLRQTATLNIICTLYVDAAQTADYQMTLGLRHILSSGGNDEDLMGFMAARALTSEEYELRALAADILQTPPEQGWLTISPALQWRLQYKRVMEQAGNITGLQALYRSAST